MSWWKEAVFYQVYPRSFQDSTGSGIGDLPGITKRLPYLANTLGVDALWLSPFFRSPMDDFGYDVSDHCDVDPIFGSLDDFDHLIERAHELGLKVVIDYVINHVSSAHRWFRSALAGPESPFREFFVWRDPKPDGSPPNNWLSVFGGPAWELDEKSGQYYLHSFLASQPDLNWRNPRLRDAMFEVLRFWLARGVDGFRIDAGHFVGKDEQFRDNPPNPATGIYHKPLGDYDKFLHPYDKGDPFVHDVFRALRSVVDEYAPDRVTIGEFHIYDWKEWASYFGENLDEVHLPFNFQLLKSAFDTEGVRGVIEGQEGAVPHGAWPNYVMGNHDEPRVATRIGPERARLAAVLLLTVRGTPTLYYGDELGMEDAEVPLERAVDPWGQRLGMAHLSRDPCRAPMAWSPGPTAGFSEASPDALWLPLSPGMESGGVEAQLADPTSMLSLHRALLALRRERDALRLGSMELLETQPDVLAYVRTHQRERILVALSFAESERRLPAIGARLLSTHQGESATLRPGEGVVLSLPPDPTPIDS